MKAAGLREFEKRDEAGARKLLVRAEEAAFRQAA